MWHDHEWHRAQTRRQRTRGRDWVVRAPRQPRSRGRLPQLGAMAAIGLVAGLAIAQGLNVSDRERYQHLLTAIGMADAGAERGAMD